jgi:hypothetical protein
MAKEAGIDCRAISTAAWLISNKSEATVLAGLVETTPKTRAAISLALTSVVWTKILPSPLVTLSSTPALCKEEAILLAKMRSQFCLVQLSLSVISP